MEIDILKIREILTSRLGQKSEVHFSFEHKNNISIRILSFIDGKWWKSEICMNIKFFTIGFDEKVFNFMIENMITKIQYNVTRKK